MLYIAAISPKLSVYECSVCGFIKCAKSIANLVFKGCVFCPRPLEIYVAWVAFGGPTFIATLLKFFVFFLNLSVFNSFLLR